MTGRAWLGVARKLGLVALVALGLLCAVAVGAYVGNQSLPGPTDDPERLEPLDKARIEEANRLRRRHGDAAWPGWAAAAIPVRVTNGVTQFLVDFPEPPPEWTRVGDDAIGGRSYYRQPEPEPVEDASPGAAPEPAEDRRWVSGRPVASLVAKRAMDRHLIRQFATTLPEPIRPFVPYRRLVQSTDAYIASLLNAAMQAHLAALAPERVDAARLAFENISGYPFRHPALIDAWPEEVAALIAAATEPDENASRAAARRFLEVRDERRRAAPLDPWSVHLEKQSEWLKGIAMYAELETWRHAGEAPGDIAAGLREDAAFDGYRGYEDHWSQVLSVAQSCSRRPCPMRFQYTGMLQARYLDRHAPGWQTLVLGDDVFLEDLVRRTVDEQSRG